MDFTARKHLPAVERPHLSTGIRPTASVHSLPAADLPREPLLKLHQLHILQAKIKGSKLMSSNILTYPAGMPCGFMDRPKLNIIASRSIVLLVLTPW
jgi:hypothetical protein